MSAQVGLFRRKDRLSIGKIAHHRGFDRGGLAGRNRVAHRNRIGYSNGIAGRHVAGGVYRWMSCVVKASKQHVSMEQCEYRFSIGWKKKRGRKIYIKK